MLMHLPMNRFQRFLKRAFQKFLVIVVMMMVRGVAMLVIVMVVMLRRALPQELQAAVYQGQHVLRGFRAEYAVFRSAGDIHR